MTLSAATCHHCAQKVGRDAVIRPIQGVDRTFCCQGCLAVCELIHAEGLDGFYRHRSQTLITPESIDDVTEQEYRLYDVPALQETFVVPHTDQTLEATLLITGLSCAACIWLIEQHMAKHPGLVRLDINHSTQRARLVWDPQQTRLSDILLGIRALGFTIRPFQADQAEQALEHEQKRAIVRLLLAGIGTMQSMMLAIPLYFGLLNDVTETQQQFFRYVSWLIATPVVFYSAGPFFRAALRDIRTRYLTMDVPVSLGIGFAYLASAWITLFGGEEVYFDAVCMFTFFLSLGRFLEQRARLTFGLASQSVQQLIPPAARRMSDAGEEVILSHRLQPGDRILVRPGEAIPADGRILQGESAINEAALTGEYLPETRRPGDAVSAGTLNGENPLVIEVDRAGQNTRLSAILRVLERAQSDKPRTAQVADRIARFFVARVLIISALVYIGWSLAGSDRAFDIMLSVLVVTCPCALSLATPTALTAATTTLRRAGFLPTRGHALEALADIDTLVFDKTGTLTEGTLRRTRTTQLGMIDTDRCIAIAAGMEHHSEHPIAHAFRDDPRIQISEVTNHPGGGLSAQHEDQTYYLGHAAFIQTHLALPMAPEATHTGPAIYLAHADGWLARFDLDDQPRYTAREAIRALHALGIRTEMLSGDRSQHVAHVAKALGIEHYTAGASPEAKLAHLQSLEKDGRQVAMTGDGLNDLPVMAGARLSIAMGSGTDITQVQADAILLTNQLDILPEAIHIARQTRRVIKQNMSWALGYNLVALPVAIAGLVPPWAAAIGMSASSLIVVLNALRLTRSKVQATRESAAIETSPLTQNPV